MQGNGGGGACLNSGEVTREKRRTWWFLESGAVFQSSLDRTGHSVAGPDGPKRDGYLHQGQAHLTALSRVHANHNGQRKFTLPPPI